MTAKVVGANILASRITQEWQQGTTPVNRCGFIMPTDILYYKDGDTLLMLDEEHDVDGEPHEEAFGKDTEFRGSTLYHPMALPKALGNMAIATEWPWIGGLIRDDPEFWREMLETDLTQEMINEVFSVAKECPTVKTLYLSYMRRGLQRQRVSCDYDLERTSRYIKISYQEDAEAEEMFNSLHMERPIPVFVDLYDDERLAEIMSLNTQAFQPDPTDSGHGRGRCLHQWCINCSRRGWETGDKEKAELIWLSTYIEELETEEEKLAVLGADGMSINRDNEWVQDKLARMPKLKPFALFLLSSQENVNENSDDENASLES